MAESQRLKVGLSGNLKKTFQTAVKGRSDVPEGVKRCLKEGDYVGVEEIIWLRANLKEGMWIHTALTDSDICIPEPYVAPRNPELEARCQRLKAQIAEKEYRQMTKNVDSSRVHHPEDTLKYQLDAMNRQLIAVFQFVVSVGAGFTFGFYGIQLMTGPQDFGFRLLLGIIFSLIIALAEIYFLAKKLANDMDFPDLPKSKAD